MKSGVTETLDHLTGLPLEQAILNKTAKVSVIGLGYVGLPLIRTFIAAGFKTFQIDVDARKGGKPAGRTQLHRTHILGVDWAVHEAKGNFSPTADMGRLAEADALLICVPDAAEPQPGSRPCFCQGVGPLCGRASAAGPVDYAGKHNLPRHDSRDRIADPGTDRSEVGQGLFSGLQPRTGRPGQSEFTAGNIPKVVGGSEPLTLQLAAQLYRQGHAGGDPGQQLRSGRACKIWKTRTGSQYRPGQRIEGSLRSAWD